MKIAIRICNKTVLLDPEQFEQLNQAIEGLETMDEEHVGEHKGYTGYKNSYVYAFNKFNCERDLDARVWTEATYDKYKTLHLYSKQPKENEQPKEKEND